MSEEAGDAGSRKRRLGLLATARAGDRDRGRGVRSRRRRRSGTARRVRPTPIIVDHPQPDQHRPGRLAASTALWWNSTLACNARGHAGNTWPARATFFHQNLGALIRDPLYVNYASLGENILVGPGGMNGDDIHDGVDELAGPLRQHHGLVRRHRHRRGREVRTDGCGPSRNSAATSDLPPVSITRAGPARRPGRSAEATRRWSSRSSSPAVMVGWIGTATRRPRPRRPRR